jgi:hypothetical protein
MKLSFLVALAGFIFSSASFGSSYSGNYEYLAKYNYSGVAFGKKVKSVMLHTGVVREEKSSMPTPTDYKYWANVTDIEMTPVGDHFYAKNDFKNLMGSVTEVGFMLPVAIGAQYWVTFDAKMKADVVDQFNNSQDASSTVVVLIGGL